MSQRAPRPKRNALGDETRELLLTVAERLFAHRGIDGVSLREIAAEARLRNPSAVHYHFGSKDDLVAAVVAMTAPHIHARRTELIEAMMAADRFGPRDLAEAIVVPLAERLEGTGNYFGFLAQLTRSRPEALWSNPDVASGMRVLEKFEDEVFPELAPRLRQARARIVTSSLPTVLADYQRARRNRERDLPSVELFTSYLVDIVAALVSVPPSAETLTLLPRRRRPPASKNTKGSSDASTPRSAPARRRLEPAVSGPAEAEARRAERRDDPVRRSRVQPVRLLRG